MSGDYKYDMQMIAEEIAQEEYGEDFYDLPSDLQHQVFLRAEDRWVDRAASGADYLNDLAREQ